MATLTVNGVGSASKPANQIHIRLHLQAEDMDYARTMALSSEQLSEVQQAVHALGYDKRALISEHYSINTNYQSVQKGEHFEQVFIGYRASQSLILKLDKEDEKLNELLTSFCALVTKPELYLSFAVERTDDLARASIELAVKDAHEKALILCRASGQILGKILSIRYPALINEQAPILEKRTYMADAQIDLQMEAADFMVQTVVEIQYETLDKSGA